MGFQGMGWAPACAAVSRAVHTVCPHHVCVFPAASPRSSPHPSHRILTLPTGVRPVGISSRPFLHPIPPNHPARVCKASQGVFERGIICI